MNAAIAAVSIPLRIVRSRTALSSSLAPRIAAPVALGCRWDAPTTTRRTQSLPSSRLLARSSSDMSGEAEKAQLGKDDGKPTIFDRVINKEIPAEIVYEDEKVLAFRDISPVAPTHFLVIPKVRDGLTMLSNAKESHKEILGHLMWAAQHTAKELGLTDGYRVVINNGPDGCQSVYHLHLHVVGGKQLSWPPGV